MQSKVTVKCYQNQTFVIPWQQGMTAQDVLVAIHKHHHYQGAVGLFSSGVVLEMHTTLCPDQILHALIDSHVFHNSKTSRNVHNLEFLKSEK